MVRLLSGRECDLQLCPIRIAISAPDRRCSRKKDLMMSVSSWFSKMFGADLTLDNLECLLVMQLRDLASAEDQLIEALPNMADAASSPDLKNAFATHLMETRQQR